MGKIGSLAVKNMVSKQLTMMALEKQILTKLSKAKTSSVVASERSRILLEVSKGFSNMVVQENLKISWSKVKRWRDRWLEFEPLFADIRSKYEGKEQESKLRESIYRCINDGPRPGSPAKITAQMYCQILGVSVEHPSLSGRPITQWTLDELLDEVLKRKIVPTISRSQLGSFLKRSRREAA